ncbi:MAG: dTMP kinase [Myxococcales bacterium]|nr:dTMP kinase [Myxococcales bacterium]
MFLVIEGIDGAGTTTQTQRLAEALEDRGTPTHRTREPSDGPIGKLLRQILAGEHAPTDATTLGLLFAADRADHLQREIEPALAAGKVVLSDRYYHSSLAYQGSEEDRSWIAVLNQRANVPDCTFFLEVDPKVAAQRRDDDDRDEELFDKMETQLRVAEGYRQVVDERESSERIERIDGHQSLDTIHETLLGRTEELLAERATR